ncbi:hypothetical protein [uncultured Jatrophihabitans sp.]|uniref:hypothetical protein n=1 Tax=uncultured Jatrophihabitans sp. TaxID=1610747 RepID=UPI0035CC0FE6
MRLAIADPPYPPQYSERYDTAAGGTRITMRSRAQRWYGTDRRSGNGKPADVHPAANEWDSPRRHRDLLEQLLDQYDGWAIATTPDGLDHYRPLPIPCRTLAWVKTTGGIPGGHRIRSSWEPVIAYPPRGRRGRAEHGRQVRDVLIAAPGVRNFIGSKPAAWTRWVLDALGYDPETDTVDDLFPGSGAVSAEIARGVLL